MRLLNSGNMTAKQFYFLVNLSTGVIGKEARSLLNKRDIKAKKVALVIHDA